VSNAVDLDVRTIESADWAELYVTARPPGGASAENQAAALFSSIAETLHSAGARLFQERIFATADAMPVAMSARGQAYGDLDDGIAPAQLAVPQGTRGPLAGVQVHAVRGPVQPQPICSRSPCCGRYSEKRDIRFLSISGMTSPRRGTATQQAWAMLGKTECPLHAVGGDVLTVVRTWMWLGDILSWYDEFNETRNRFFRQHRLINEDRRRVRLPASTGIGIGPADGSKCAIGLFAVVGAEASSEFLLAGGCQQPAFNYGSAFSRASRSVTPAGEAVFVSGTASIDSSGRTEHVGDPERQIDAVIEYVRAVLLQTHCRDEDVVQSLVYCKTPEVEELFLRRYGDLTWPCITTIADICREELLFEVEATAIPRQ